jgi:hypothetical protein
MLHRAVLGAVCNRNRFSKSGWLIVQVRRDMTAVGHEDGVENEHIPKLTASEFFMRRRRWQASTNILHKHVEVRKLGMCPCKSGENTRAICGFE